ncbi:hypothetical protein PIB30_074215, partial [Stylosanthes scabra]|nr:hypothetical protein [Stylosanthes scabra]
TIASKILSPTTDYCFNPRGNHVLSNLDEAASVQICNLGSVTSSSSSSFNIGLIFRDLNY